MHLYVQNKHLVGLCREFKLHDGSLIKQLINIFCISLAYI